MSDERDETRRYPSADRPDGRPGANPAAPDDRTQVHRPGRDDRTQVHRQGGDDRTQVHRPGPDDRTQIHPSGGGDRPQIHRPAGDEPTRVNRPDSTSVMPPANDDWATSRANPVWSGRAEVRGPRAGSAYDTNWDAGPVPVRRDRWWMPIVVGTVVLILLAALGWGVYVIVQNSSGSGSPAPAPTATFAPSLQPATTPSAETTTPSAAPATTTLAPGPSTTEPAQTEVTVPALRGQALADAQAALVRTGLRYRLIYRASDSPANTVIDSDPAEGQEVPPDTVVTLVVAKGAATTPTATSTTAGPANGTDDGD